MIKRVSLKHNHPMMPGFAFSSPTLHSPRLEWPLYVAPQTRSVLRNPPLKPLAPLVQRYTTALTLVEQVISRSSLLLLAKSISLHGQWFRQRAFLSPADLLLRDFVRLDRVQHDLCNILTSWWDARVAF